MRYSVVEKNTTTFSHESDPRPTVLFALLGLTTFLAAFLRLYHLQERGFETIEMIYNRLAYHIIFQNELVYNYVKPGYVFFLFLVGKLFGYHSTTLLYISAIFGILTVLMVYLLGNRLFNARVGLVSAFVLAVMPYHVWISRMGMAYSIGLFLFALSLMVYLQALSASSKKGFFALFGLLGLINGAMFTLHPGLSGCAFCIAGFDFFRTLFESPSRGIWGRLFKIYLPRWLIFTIFFFLPLIFFECVTKDIASEDSFIRSHVADIKNSAEMYTYPGDYFQSINHFAINSVDLWGGDKYSSDNGYDFYIRILLRESGFFNFFFIIGGFALVNFLYLRKKLSFEQTIFGNIFLLAFIFWTFNPRMPFSARRNFTPAIVPAALASGVALACLIKRRWAFYMSITLVFAGSAMVSWQYVSVTTRHGHLIKYLKEKKIGKVMIIPGICYPEEPFLADRNIRSLNLESYRKLYSQIPPERILNHELKTRYLVSNGPEIDILGKKFRAEDKIVGDIPAYNGENYSYPFKDVFPWLKIGFRRDQVLYHIYDLNQDWQTVKRAFVLSKGESPWSVPGHINIGNYLLSRGMADEALREFRLAVESSEKSPMNITTYFQYAEALYRLGRLDDSETAYKRVIASIIRARETDLKKRRRRADSAWERQAFQTSVSRIKEISAKRDIKEFKPQRDTE